MQKLIGEIRNNERDATTEDNKNKNIKYRHKNKRTKYNKRQLNVTGQRPMHDIFREMHEST